MEDPAKAGFRLLTLLLSPGNYFLLYLDSLLFMYLLTVRHF